MTILPSNHSGAPGKPFYRDDFSALDAVAQYDSFFKLGLTDQEKSDLMQDLFGGSDLAQPRGDGDPLNRGGWS